MLLSLLCHIGRRISCFKASAPVCSACNPNLNKSSQQGAEAAALYAGSQKHSQQSGTDHIDVALPTLLFKTSLAPRSVFACEGCSSVKSLKVPALALFTHDQQLSVSTSQLYHQQSQLVSQLICSTLACIVFIMVGCKCMDLYMAPYSMTSLQYTHNGEQ